MELLSINIDNNIGNAIASISLFSNVLTGEDFKWGNGNSGAEFCLWSSSFMVMSGST